MKRKKRKTKTMWMWKDRDGRSWMSPTLKEAERCIREEYGLTEDEIFPKVAAGVGDHLIPMTVDTRKLTGDTAEVRVPGSDWMVVQMQPVFYTS